MKTWMTFLMLVALAGCHRVNTGETEDEAAYQQTPKGFEWQPLAEIKGACLKPTGWYFSKVLKKDYIVYRLTREKVSADNQFLTGLSIHACQHVPQVKGMSPSQMAANQLREYARDKQVIEEYAPRQVGAMIQSGGTYQREMTLMGQRQSFTIHMTMLANDSTGTLYIMVYGCPENQWGKFLNTISTKSLSSLNRMW